ncbi:MAG TPA: prepilin-type N-terminal cleavage/methylation domain-containing protein [Verrucomicrobiae bacterium]|nr:prepilin-type N-terminal cleavage/methylation domain-containing protein [Verrucomicrobiae bacterium]
MKLPCHSSPLAKNFTRRSRAFTLMEVMIASSIGLFVMAAAMWFLWFSGLAISGVTAQGLTTQRAGNAIEFIQSRVRFAVSITNDSSGNALTLGFDDDPTTDSDHDSVPYNDNDHFERFQFIGVNGSSTTSNTNSLVYYPNITRTNRQVLIAAGVRNLPGYNIFTVTNRSTSIVRFGVVDGNASDHYQSIDIQATAVPLNRPATTNFIAILP